VLAFEESATGAETTVNKVWILSQESALGKVAQGGVKEGKAKIAVGAWRSSCRQSAGERKVSADASWVITRFV
jgi:hypothetical protein